MDRLKLSREIVKQIPDVREHLEPRTRYRLFEPAEYKTAEYMLRVIENLVRGVYDGYIGGQFIDTMANLISGQLLDAYQRAWTDEGFTGDLPEYLMAGYTEDVLNQYDFVDQFYRAIVDARVDGTTIDALMMRAQLWGNQWNNSYQKAVRLIANENGAKLMWVEGDTEDKCATCLGLDGKVMYAREWEALGLHPGDGPNNHLDCGGWHCQCQLVPTDERRSPNAYGRIEEMMLGRA